MDRILWDGSELVSQSLNLLRGMGDLSPVNVLDCQPTPTPARATSAADNRLSQVEKQLLILRTQQHDHEAFNELLNLYERRVLYYVCRLIGDLEAALDVSQDVWLTVYQRIGTLRSLEAFRVWLFRIAHNKATTSARRGQRRVELNEGKKVSVDGIEIFVSRVGLKPVAS